MKKIYLLLFILSWLKICAASISWSDPLAISNPGINASDPHVGIDTSGNVVAIWVENTYVQASHLPIGGSWSTPVTISNSGASSPHLAVDPSGNATAIWLEAGVVKTSSQLLGGSWSAETTLSGTGAATSPKIAIDASGNVVVVWVQTISGTASIQSVTQLFGGSWPGTPDTISGSTTSPSSPAVSIGADGTVVAVWHAVSGVDDTINSASKTINGGTWATPLTVFTPTNAYNCDLPVVTVDPLGKASIAWFQYNISGSTYSNVSVVTSTLSTGTVTWSTPTVLTTGGVWAPNLLSLAIKCDSYGNLAVLWTTCLDLQAQNVQTAVSSNGGGWVKTTPLVLCNIYAYSAAIGVNTNGYAVAIYMLFDGSSIIIQSVESDIAAHIANYWSGMQTVSSGTNNGYPSIQLARTSSLLRATAVWLQSNGSNNLVQAITGSKPEVAPPTNFSITQNSNDFGIFKEYYNKLSWTASTDPSLLRYVIYRNGMFLSAVEATAVEFMDHNVVQNGSATYSISAVDVNLEQSPYVTITYP